MLIGERARYGMASILAYKCSGCSQNILLQHQQELILHVAASTGAVI